jgi:hypothetical protein
MRSSLLLALAALAPLAACSGGVETTPQGGSTSTSTTTSTTSTSSATGGAAGWTAPACATISGTAAVTFTRDEGQTLAPTAETLTPIGYTFGLVALDTPNVLLAEHKGSILRSEDAGCTWKTVGAVGGSPLVLVAAQGDRAYAFKDNDAPLYRIDGGVITELTGPATSVLGLGVDPLDGAHLRLGDQNGQLWESKDAGASWGLAGVPAPVGDLPLVYRFAFDPHDLSRVIVGAATVGAARSDDGGATWTLAAGLGSGHTNVFSVVIAPSDGQVVWTQGIDLDHTGDPVSAGRTIWRSTDGGQTFTQVAQQTADVTIRNQELLAAHPTDTKLLYFVFGTYFSGYGTDVYRYDHGTGKVTKTHNAYDDVSAIAFSPTTPPVMYLGLTADSHN